MTRARTAFLGKGSQSYWDGDGELRCKWRSTAVPEYVSELTFAASSFKAKGILENVHQCIIVNRLREFKSKWKKMLAGLQKGISCLLFI